jgi:hypothetical protein
MTNLRSKYIAYKNLSGSKMNLDQKSWSGSEFDLYESWFILKIDLDQ